MVCFMMSPDQWEVFRDDASSAKASTGWKHIPVQHAIIPNTVKTARKRVPVHIVVSCRNGLNEKLSLKAKIKSRLI